MLPTGSKAITMPGRMEGEIRFYFQGSIGEKERDQIKLKKKFRMNDP
jgi:hypothetical protein